ncbi:hypothetical protein [Mesorhizobium caraganae]|uniref:hypothetical protein n=1 Tax=Mesorhizobium caraganae TaxID=483206 RepID=UPI00333ABB53
MTLHFKRSRRRALEEVTAKAATITLAFHNQVLMEKGAVKFSSDASAFFDASETGSRT